MKFLDPWKKAGFQDLDGIASELSRDPEQILLVDEGNFIVLKLAIVLQIT